MEKKTDSKQRQDEKKREKKFAVGGRDRTRKKKNYRERIKKKKQVYREINKTKNKTSKRGGRGLRNSEMF